MKNLKITAQDLEKMGIIDDIIPELIIKSEEDAVRQSGIIKSYILKYLRELMPLEHELIMEKRKNKYKNIGCFNKEEDKNGK